MKLSVKEHEKICLKLQSGKRDYVGLVMYNAWKTAEEQDRHCVGFLAK